MNKLNFSFYHYLGYQIKLMEKIFLSVSYMIERIEIVESSNTLILKIYCIITSEGQNIALH